MIWKAPEQDCRMGVFDPPGRPGTWDYALYMARWNVEFGGECWIVRGHRWVDDPLHVEQQRWFYLAERWDRRPS